MSRAIHPLILDWLTIEAALEQVDVISAMMDAFMAYSSGRAVIPPVGELAFDSPPGDVHIKYGYLKDGSHYVVKIASGFYENPTLGLPSSQGLMLLFEQTTGQLASVLLDEGKLTDLRTGAAGAVAAHQLANKDIDAIGIIGAGIQARHQLSQLAAVTPCRRVYAWARNPERLAAYARDAEAMGFETLTVSSPEAVASACQLIVTTTPSTEPLLKAQWVRPGTHITAVGADTPFKQELDAALVGRADVVVADSLAQAKTRGEIFRATSAGAMSTYRAIELGALLSGQVQGRTHHDQITVADLTGVAIQDLAIAHAVYAHCAHA